MSDLILSLSHYHRHIAIYVIADNRHDVRPYVSFTEFALYIVLYVVVSISTYI